MQDRRVAYTLRRDGREPVSFVRRLDLDVDQERLRLAVSEVVSNALVHGSSVIDLRLSAEADAVMVEVGDDASPASTPRLDPGRDMGGLGLQIVDTIRQRTRCDRSARIPAAR